MADIRKSTGHSFEDWRVAVIGLWRTQADFFVQDRPADEADLRDYYEADESAGTASYVLYDHIEDVALGLTR